MYTAYDPSRKEKRKKGSISREARNCKRYNCMSISIRIFDGAEGMGMKRNEGNRALQDEVARINVMVVGVEEALNVTGIAKQVVCDDAPLKRILI